MFDIDVPRAEIRTGQTPMTYYDLYSVMGANAQQIVQSPLPFHQPFSGTRHRHDINFKINVL